MRPLALSRMTLVTGLGAGLAAHLAALRSGRSALAPCRFETAALETWVAEADGLDAVRLRPDLARFDCRNNRLAQRALDSDGFAAAVEAACERYGADRIGLFLGTSTSGIREGELAYRRRDPATGALPAGFDYEATQDTFSLGAFVRRALRLSGPAAVASAACATTAKVFGNARRMIEAGVCDAAVVGGADSLCLTTLYGFNALELLARGPCRPFDAERDGISLGEGAGFVLLEQAEHAAADVLLLGIGESGDAHHMSTPHPEGLGARLAMERALASAGRAASAIDYVNLHGTATKGGDAVEDRAVTALFGAATPCSSTKGHTGHLLGAAGIAETIFAALALEHGLMPGSPHTRAIDPAFRSRYVAAPAAAPLRAAMSNSFGFGGSNCSLVLGRAA